MIAEGAKRAKDAKKDDGAWTVFLDRDGTLNVDQVRGVDIAKLELMPGAREALALWKAAGWKLIVITNQTGLARGLYTRAQMDAFHLALEERLGVRMDGFYVCPHAADAGCACRKPRTGLFEAAIREQGIDPRRSFTIGDKPWDIEAGTAAGTRTVFVPSEARAAPPADHVARDLADAARWTLAVARAAR